MSALKIQCTGCAAILKLPGSPAPGKRIRCPKCGEVFVPELAPVEEKEPVAVAARKATASTSPEDSDEGGVYVLEELAPASPPPEVEKPIQKSAYFKPLKKKANPYRNWIIAGVVAASVVLLGAIGGGVFLGHRYYVKSHANPLVTHENFQKLHPGMTIADAEQILGEMTPVKSEEVEAAWADALQASAAKVAKVSGVRVDPKVAREGVKGALKGYANVRWVRWRDYTTVIYGGSTEGAERTARLSLIGYLNEDGDQSTSEWKSETVGAETKAAGAAPGSDRPASKARTGRKR